MKEKKKKTGLDDDFLSKEAKEERETALDYTQEIPDDEIWTYQVEGLAAPSIGKKVKNAKLKKTVFIIVLLLAIGLAMYFSIRTVHTDEYEYELLADGTYMLVSFSNTGDTTDIVVDYVVDLETGEKDYTKVVSAIDEYAFNCDEYLISITIGESVNTIDCKSIYSCWYVQNVYVDENNEYFCDIDGVLYTKDLTEIIYYPTDHDAYLRTQTGYDNLLDDDGNAMTELWETTERYDEEFLAEYNSAVRTYVLPSTVTTIGDLAFAYSNITALYIPEGVTYMGSMALFDNTVLLNIYSYTCDEVITDTTSAAIASMKTVYNSLPEGLEYIGSDCFYYTRALTYIYIPSSVTYIGHHAFWGAAYKDDGVLYGITEINVALSEDEFEEQVDVGDQWRPSYYRTLFKTSVPVNYSAERE